MKLIKVTVAQLRLNPEINARADNENDLAGLKAQIAAKGFADPILVRKAGKAYEIIDGSRRFRAVKELIAEKAAPKALEIAALVVSADDAAARELSLAANVMRRELSPADEAVAFRRLILSGMEEDEVAAHFAVTRRHVLQRLAIGSLPAEILAALRDGAIDMRTAQAFTLTSSAERQLALFHKLVKQGRLSSWSVKESLQASNVSGNDMRARFVGPEAFEAAGGVISRSLFDDHEIWSNEKLLDTLFEDRLAATVRAIEAEGWSFVIVERHNGSAFHGWSRLSRKERGDLTAEEKKQLAALRKTVEKNTREIDRLDRKEEATADEDERRDRLVGEIDELEEKVAALTLAPYSDKQKARSGAVIIAEPGAGEVEILRGVQKPNKAKKEPAIPAGAGGPGEMSAAAEEGALDLSDAIRADLAEAAQKACKLAMVLEKPAIAARFGLAARVLAAVDRAHHAPFEFDQHRTVSGPRFDEVRSAILGMFPAGGVGDGITLADVLATIETLEPEAVTRLEALLAADCLHFYSTAIDKARLLFDAIDPDMRSAGWEADAAFLNRLTRAQLAAICREIDPAAEPKLGKKPDMIAALAPRVAETGWLPQPLRGPSYAGPGSNAWAERIAGMAPADAAAETLQAAE